MTIQGVSFEASLFPDLEYTFKHALTHEVTYSSLLQGRRRALHGRIVEAIERLHPDRLPEHIERLAYHAFRGEVWEKAGPYLYQAGAKAFARSAHQEAVTCFERALDALSHLPESRERLELATDLHFDLATSRLPLGQLERGLRDLRAAEGLAKTLGNQRRLGWVSAYMCDYLWVTGDSTESRAFGLSAQAIAETIEDFQLKIAADFYLGVACFTLGDYGQAEALCRKVVESLAGDLTHKRFRLTEFPASGPRYYLALTLAERGEFDEGITIAQEAIRLAEAADHPFSLVLACWSLAYLYGLRGELAPAVRLLERGVALSRESDLTALSPRLMGSLGSAYARSQRVADGLSLLHQALTEMETLGIGGYHSLLVLGLAEACLLADRFDEALAAASRALTLARSRGERGYEAWALGLLGDIAARGDVPGIDQAETHYLDAWALADELRMRPLMALCHFGLGKLYRRAAGGAKAREHLATATRMYREMDMGFWLEKTEALT